MYRQAAGARSGACLKNHSRNLHAPLCGIFHPNSVAVQAVTVFQLHDTHPFFQPVGFSLPYDRRHSMFLAKKCCCVLFYLLQPGFNQVLVISEAIPIAEATSAATVTTAISN